MQKNPTPWDTKTSYLVNEGLRSKRKELLRPSANFLNLRLSTQALFIPTNRIHSQSCRHEADTLNLRVLKKRKEEKSGWLMSPSFRILTCLNIGHFWWGVADELGNSVCMYFRSRR